MARSTPTPSEKVLAIADIFRALCDELPDRVAFFDPNVQAAIIDASVSIALSTDTSDMGIMSSRGIDVADLIDRAHAISPETGESIEDLTKGDHFAHPDAG